MKINIGLDIGIASVGWSILDENLKIIKHGVRLFPTVDAAKDSKLANQTRREKRSLRRQINRRRNLKLDFIKLLKSHNLIDIEIDRNDVKEFSYLHKFVKNFINDRINMFDLRKKALQEAIPLNNLIQVLYWYLSHRGYKYNVVEDQEKVKIQKEYSAMFNFDDLPLNNQIKHFQLHNYYRSEINREFATKNYLKELKLIFNNQKLDQNFVKKYLDLFERQRSFEQGPGPEYQNLPLKNFDNISPYSRYCVDPTTKQLQWETSIWKKTIGRCTYDNNEYRAPKNALTSEIFNLLNDLNNLFVVDDQNIKYKLDQSAKLACLQVAFQTKDATKKIFDIFVKKFNVEKQDIRGFRIDKNKKPLITQLTSIHFINKLLKMHHQDLITFDQKLINDRDNQVNQIINILSQSKIIEKRVEKLTQLTFLNDQALITALANKQGFSDTHSLSYKTMHLMIPTLLNENKNQMQLAHEWGWKKTLDIEMHDRTYLPTSWIETVIGTPSVKRALRQTINLLNAIIKQYKNYQIDNIVIEMAREHKNIAAREAENQLQKFMEEQNERLKSLIDEIKDRNGLVEIKGQSLVKLWLYEQQKGQDAYSGESLDLDQVVINPHYADIDHIIPLSQSFDDSRNNKVLTLKVHNAIKGQKTPYQAWGQSDRYLGLKKLWDDWYNPKNNLNDRKVFAAKKKLEFLTSELDYTNPNNFLGFIKRNLVDTSYISSQLLAIIKQFSENVTKCHPLFSVKIKTVNGKMTNFYRKMLEKNGKLMRPEDITQGSFDPKTNKKLRIWNGHHAEDATIIVHVALGNYHLHKIIEKILSDPHIEKIDRDDVANKKLIKQNPQIITKQIVDLRNDLNDNMNNIKFSYMLNKQRNTQLFNETIYAGKVINKQLHKVEKLKLIDLKKEILAKLFSKTSNQEELAKIPMAKHDPKTFAALKNIYKNYENENLPFKKAEHKNGIILIEIANKQGQMIQKSVKTIRRIAESKNLEDIIIRKKDKTSFHETMQWTELHLFKDNKNNYKIIPINALTATFFPNKTFQYKQLYYKKILDLGLKDGAQPLYKIYRGTLLLSPDNVLYRVCGYDMSTSRLRIKLLYKSQKNEFFLKTFKALAGFKIVQNDYLGNIFWDQKIIFTNKTQQSKSQSLLKQTISV